MPSRYTKETAVQAGKKSAAKLSPQELSLRAAALGNTTLQRYGVGYFKSISNMAAVSRLRKKLR